MLRLTHRVRLDSRRDGRYSVTLRGGGVIATCTGLRHPRVTGFSQESRPDPRMVRLCDYEGLSGRDPAAARPASVPTLSPRTLTAVRGCGSGGTRPGSLPIPGRDSPSSG